MPDLPGGSSAAPTLYHSVCTTMGARGFSTTTTSSPLSRVKVLGLNTPAWDGPWESAAADSSAARVPRRYAFS